MAIGGVDSSSLLSAATAAQSSSSGSSSSSNSVGSSQFSDLLKTYMTTQLGSVSGLGSSDSSLSDMMALSMMGGTDSLSGTGTDNSLSTLMMMYMMQNEREKESEAALAEAGVTTEQPGTVQASAGTSSGQTKTQDSGLSRTTLYSTSPTERIYAAVEAYRQMGAQIRARATEAVRSVISSKRGS